MFHECEYSPLCIVYCVRYNYRSFSNTIDWLFNFTCCSYIIFNEVNLTCITKCSSLILHFLQAMYDPNVLPTDPNKTCRRLVKTFCKGLIKLTEDRMRICNPPLALSERRKRKFQPT